MENIVGNFIKQIREKLNKTQSQLAQELFVSEKTISKWETGRGLPSLSLIEPLAKSLKISVAELFNGNQIINMNKSSNIMKSKFYVCPICGNIITSCGEVAVSCCGVKLVEEECEDVDSKQYLNIIDDKYNFVAISPMTKQDYISFVAYITMDSVKLIKLYPEQNCEVNFERNGHGYIYFYDIKNGLFRMKI